LKINSENNNKIFNVWTLFLKIKNGDLESSKHFKFLHLTRFSYKKFNERDKLKFGDDLMYFWVKLKIFLLYIYIYREREREREVC
jgi:hypothetical protein